MCSSYRDVGASGGLAGFVLPLSKCLVNRDSETDRVFLGEGLSFVTVRAYDGLSWDTPAGYLSFESRARGYEADGNLLMFGCRELET